VTKQGYLKINWQTVAAIIRKATGLEYRSYFTGKEGFRCESRYGSNHMAVEYSGPFTGDQRATLPPEKIDELNARRDQLMNRAVAALEAQGYEVKRPGNPDYLYVAMRDAPDRPFRAESAHSVSEMKGKNRHLGDHWSYPSVRLYRLDITTHEHRYPQRGWRVTWCFDTHTESEDFAGYGDAVRAYGHWCAELAALDAQADLTEHPTEVAPTEEEIAAAQAAWEIELAAYYESHPRQRPKEEVA